MAMMAMMAIDGDEAMMAMMAMAVMMAMEHGSWRGLWMLPSKGVGPTVTAAAMGRSR